MTIVNSSTSESPPQSAPSHLTSVIMWLALFLLLILFSGGSLHLWSGQGVTFLGQRAGAVILVLLVLIIGRRAVQVRDPFAPAEAAAYALIVVFVSDWLTRSYNLFQGPSIRGELLLASALAYLLVRKGREVPWGALLPFALLLGAYGFLVSAEGRLIFSDDHPTFLYRLLLLRENFPHIPFYLPLWNGGIDARDFFATGALNVFLLYAPIIYLSDLFTTYNYIVALALFFVLPAASYGAARILSLSSTTAALSAVLTVSSSLTWYRWALKYGTMGFITSSALLLPVIALSVRILFEPERLTRRHAVLFVLLASLTVMWSPAALALLPLLAWGIARVLPCLRVSRVRWIIVGLLVLNAPWMILFVNVSRVGGFLRAESVAMQPQEQFISTTADPSLAPGAVVKGRRSKISIERTVEIIRERAVSTNPLIILFTLPGILLLGRGARGVYGAVLLWLVVTGGVLSPLKPQLELDRMLVLAAVVGALPSAHALTALLRGARDATRRSRWLLLPASSLASGFALISPFVVSGITHNRSLEQFHFEEPLVRQLTRAVDQFGGEGRVFFSGFVLHHLSHGHLAPLAFMTSRPLMASTHVHNVWRYHQMIPEKVLKQGDTGIERFLDLYNVTGVVAHEPYWKHHFRERTARYREVWRGGEFVLFQRVEAKPSYFEEGRGEILAQTTSRVVLQLASPEAVVKFNYFPFLRITPQDQRASDRAPCALLPATVAPEVTLVKLRGCPTDVPLVLASDIPLARITGGPSQ